MILEDDDLFGGSPQKKYFDILFNANRNLVENYLERNLEKIVAMETLLQEHMGEDEDIERFVRNYALHNADKVQDGVTNLFIVDMGDILTQNE